MSKVTSSDFAQAQATKMLSLINNQLPGLIRQLNSHGQQLSDPSHWDGPLAQKFRGEVWPQASRDLDNMRSSLEQLQQQVQKVLGNIMAAGGK
ncbi:hypothetical protein [Streptomyces sp. NPDC021212]|uniref:hypothetical protein n=1 Tax=Streptomyces sp. NPDC021212 TaxID=3365118 RepID=UPI0037AEA1EA